MLKEHTEKKNVFSLHTCSRSALHTLQSITTNHLPGFDGPWLFAHNFYE